MNFNVNLAGKVAIVTGAGEGVGKATALALAAAGAAVGVNDLNPNRAEAVAEQIVAAGGQAVAWVADVSNKFQAVSLIETVRDRFTNLHILVNAAGTTRPAGLLNLDDYDWRRILEVNLTGTFYCMQLAARVMSDEGGGAIVNLASLYGLARSLPNHAPYMASKAGIIALTREAARELASKNIRVNAVCPGEVQETDAPVSPPTNPLGRLGTPEEVAALILFLCSEGASFITGQAIYIDGGISAL
jgi:3-oxoacyl-[acyl-carrier protein] reductase